MLLAPLGSSLVSRTRVKTLAQDTIIANARFFDNDINKVPKSALTVGVGTVMDAREVSYSQTRASIENNELLERVSPSGPHSDLWYIESVRTTHGYRRGCQSYVDRVCPSKASEISLRVRRRCHDGIESENRSILSKSSSCPFTTDRRRWSSVVVAHRELTEDEAMDPHFPRRHSISAHALSFSPTASITVVK